MFMKVRVYFYTLL